MRGYLVPTAVLVVALGCRSNAHLDAHLELLNAERRALEDELYELEYEYETAVEKLEELRDENQRLRGESGDARDEYPDFTPRIPSGGDEETLPEIPDLRPPTVDPGRPADQSQDRRSSGPLTTSPALRQPVSLGAAGPAPGNRPITRIFIDPNFTGGSDFDRRPGDDGITLRIQPRDDAGVYMPRAGNLSVVLLDYSQRGQGEDARVARWDLEADQIEQLLSDPSGRDGLHLRLPWPAAPPEHHRLRLDVRYTTRDGRHLESSRDIQITTAKQYSQEWTPRAPGQGSTEVNVARQPDRGDQARATGPPWSLEQAAGDAIRQDRLDEASPSSQQATRPTWRPYR